MKNEEKKRFRPLSNELRLGKGWKRDWNRDFGEKKGSGSKFIELRSKCLSEMKIGLTLVYI